MTPKQIFTAVGKRILLSNVVEAQIENAIRTKKFVAGMKLPSEAELCQQFKVSRTAVREALRMLSARGLVSIIKGKGIFVQNISVKTVTDPIHLYLEMQLDRNYILDVVHARQIIEPSIAASAALHHTEKDAERLRKDYSELIHSDGDYEELSRLDMQFHLDIAKSSENSLIPLILEPIHRLTPRIKSLVYATVADAKQSAIEWHGKILNAILLRNAHEAHDTMMHHLNIAEQHDRQILLRQRSNDKFAKHKPPFHEN
ncbi:MAG TPA: FadR/GntR family transcriptional regulator [Bacteroidota bacterium]|nr:FadR/GntR family transcriptional regulator [Bacteroidota bacterium]